MRETSAMTTPETPPPTPSPQVRARPRRRGGSPLDMVRSMGLVGLFVVGMVAFSFFGQPEHPPVAVDVKATVEAARMGAGFPVLAATTLPDGVYANTARFEPVAGEPGHFSYYIGYVYDTDAFLSIEASSAVGAERLKEPFPGATPKEHRSVDGVRFAVYAESENLVWFHSPTAAEPYAIRIASNSPALDELLGMLRTTGAVDAGL